MAEVLNLRRARKRKARADKEDEAAENRVRFGLTGPQRRAQAQEKDRAKRALDGHHRGDDETPAKAPAKE